MAQATCFNASRSTQRDSDAPCFYPPLFTYGSPLLSGGIHLIVFNNMILIL